MTRYYIFPHGHDGAKGRFDSADELVEYIKQGIEEDNDYRYRHGQVRKPNVIMLAFEGEVLGQFTVSSWERPSSDDKQVFPSTKRTYIIEPESQRLYKPRIHYSELAPLPSFKGRDVWRRVRFSPQLPPNEYQRLMQNRELIDP